MSAVMEASPELRTSSIVAAAEAVRAGRGAGIAEALQPYVAQGDIEAMTLVALALALTGEAARAAPMMVKVSQARPDSLHLLSDLAPLILEPNALARAEAVYHAVRELTPDDPRMWHAFSLYYTQAFRFEEALAASQRAVALPDGDNAANLNQLGIAFTGLGRLEEALTVFEDASRRWEDNYAGFSNVACTHAALGRFNEALAAYRQAIAIAPSEPQLRLNHAICLLKAGRMTQGWSEFEWRLQLPGHTDLPQKLLLPSLTEETRLDGRTVFITQDEGLGDSLQFARFIPPLAARGARVLVWVPESLAPLLARVEGVAEVMSGDRTAVTFDWHIPFMSLPRALSATSGRAGAPVPYLHATPAKVAEFAGHLPGAGSLQVGLVWAGASRPHLHWAVAVDRKRSVHLRQLAEFGQIEGVSFVSLQFGPPADQLFDPPEGMRIHDPMHEVVTMDDTAALIAGLDVVITVDTSVAHLAGGLGKTVFLLDRFDNCWRWGWGSEATALYPQMRIFRQPEPGAWAEPITRIAEALRELAVEHAAKNAGGGVRKPAGRSVARPAKRLKAGRR